MQPAQTTPRRAAASGSQASIPLFCGQETRSQMKLAVTFVFYACDEQTQPQQKERGCHFHLNAAIAKVT
jgi:hypothetical protein